MRTSWRSNSVATAWTACGCDTSMTAILTFEDIGNGRTKYTAIARHRNADTAKAHKDMGFYDGWGTVVTQLEEYAQGLKP